MVKKGQLSFIALLWIALQGPCKGIGSFGVDASVMGDFFRNTLRGHSYLLLGGDRFQLGAFYQATSFSVYNNESILGGGIQVGKDLSFFLGVGEVREEAHGFENKGVAGILVLRKKISSFLFFSVHLVGRRIDEGNDLRKEASIYPLLGVGGGL